MSQTLKRTRYVTVDQRDPDAYDLVKGIIRMMNTPDDFSGPLNLGNPENFTTRQLAETTLAKAQLGWEPTIELEEGLTRTIEWFHSADIADLRTPTQLPKLAVDDRPRRSISLVTLADLCRLRRALRQNFNFGCYDQRRVGERRRTIDGLLFRHTRKSRNK